MSDEAPKSAYELAMERLRRKDRDEGVEERAVTGEQRTLIADVRKTYEARLAEREILHRSEMRKAEDPDALDKIEEEYRRDRERLVAERERKIEDIRAGR